MVTELYLKNKGGHAVRALDLALNGKTKIEFQRIRFHPRLWFPYS